MKRGKEKMGCFYVGFDFRNYKHGYLKIGETSKNTPAARLAQIRQTDSFQCLGYITLPDVNKVERLFIESYVRLMIARNTELIHTQNDHFTYDIEQGQKYQQAQRYADYAIECAIKACDFIQVKYIIGTKQYKRG